MLARALALVFVALPSAASTIVVDASNGPGANFTDIAPAIAAAQANDVLLVKIGAYGPFTVDKPLVILALDDNFVSSSALTVQNTALGQRVVVAGVRASSARVSNCAGTVVLQRMSPLAHLRVDGSRDVRLDALTIVPVSAIPSPQALVVNTSRIEIANCEVRGAAGLGGSGIVATDARVHVSGGTVLGGLGAYPGTPSGFAGPGGSGISLAGTASACTTHTSVSGGTPGWNPNYASDCSHDGQAGIALVLSATSGPNRFTATTVFNPDTVLGTQCQIVLPGPAPYVGPYVLPPVQDPQLRLLSSPVAGTTQTFRVDGTPGTRAYFWLSRDDTLGASTAGDVELLVPHSRFFRLGDVPASGFVQFSIFLPATIPPGTVFFAQAESLPASGPAQRSNSVALVVR